MTNHLLLGANLCSPKLFRLGKTKAGHVPEKSLGETMWRAWFEKTFFQGRQRAGAAIKAVKWPCMGVLMATEVVSLYVFTPNVPAYQVTVRFAIGFGAIVIMFESVRARQYAFTALFAAIVLLFSPVFSSFALSGKWLILLANVLPFIASLVWINERTQRAAVC